MKILIFSWRDIKNPLAGGAEVLTHQLVKCLIKKGHLVHLLTAGFPNAPKKEIIEGVTIFRPAVFYQPSPWQYFSFIYRTIKYYRQYLAGRYDIVLDQVHGLPFFTPFFVKEKVVIFPLEVANSIWFYEVLFPYSLIGFLVELVYVMMFRNRPFLTISPSTAKDLKRLGVKEAAIITPGLNFPPAPRLPKKTAYPLIVSLGRITEMKRIGDTLQALRFLHKEFPLIKLLIIGRGKEPHLKNLKIDCIRMGLDDRVTFTGYVSEKEKRYLLSNAWLLVSSSLKEGWGLNVIEAAACGTPTVAYRIPGLVDSVKDKITGLLCQENNEIQLAKNIRKLLKNSAWRRKLSLNALKYSYHFSWEKTTHQMITILNQVLIR